MPIVKVKYKPDRVRESALVILIKALRPIIAEALKTSEFDLGPDQVAVDVQVVGRLEIQNADYRIVVDAFYSDERNQNLVDRVTMIREALKDIMPTENTGYVMVILHPHAEIQQI